MKGERDPRLIEAGTECHAPENIHPQAGWVLETEVVEGDILIADGGFTCLFKGQQCRVELRRKVYRYPENAVACRDGIHFLGRQKDEHGRYVGFTPMKADAA